MTKQKSSEMDYKLLEDPEMAKQALQMILRTKEGLDDFVDTLELLSNEKSRMNLEHALDEVREGKVIKMTIKELRKRSK